MDLNQQPQDSFETDEQIRIQNHREYRQRILSSYKRLHEEIYTLNPTSFFEPSFLEAVSNISDESFQNIVVEAAPGIYTFEMFQPRLCEMLLAEVQHMEKWVRESGSFITRPNMVNSFGVVLDDFGFESMLQKMVEDFITPISQVLFPEVCESGLDSHHGYVVGYGENRDTDIQFHADDSEVTLNVCLGKQFSGGNLYFGGVRCREHLNSEVLEEERYDYPHIPGQAVLHRGRHRHGAFPITNGSRHNLILWCRSSTFRARNGNRRDLWCGKCKLDRYNSKRPLI